MEQGSEIDETRSSQEAYHSSRIEVRKHSESSIVLAFTLGLYRLAVRFPIQHIPTRLGFPEDE